MRIKIRKLKRKLGISTVVANMLMILITLSLAAILVAWAGTTYGSFTGGSSLYFLQRGQALQERLVVEYVNYTKASNKMSIFVRNVGTEETNVIAIYVNGTQYTCTSASCTAGSGSMGSLCTASQLWQNGPYVVTMGVETVCQFNLVWSSAWSSGSVFNIVVTTTRGNQVVVTSRAP